MKRPRGKTAFWFGLPFLILAGVVVHSRGALQMEKNNDFFNEEIHQRIRTGMSLDEARELLKSNGFREGSFSNLRSIGLRTLPAAPSRVKDFAFVSSQSAFPRILDKHKWRVEIHALDGRILSAGGFYNYEFD